MRNNSSCEPFLAVFQAGPTPRPGFDIHNGTFMGYTFWELSSAWLFT